MPAAIEWTPELEHSIVQWIAEGKTLREFCRQEGKPSHDAVYDHEKVSEEFKQRIARAREIGEEVIAQECLAIADDGSNDYMEEKYGDDEDSSWRANGEHIQRSRLRVDTRLKLLAKWNPRKWGEKVAVGGASDLPPIQAEIQVEFVKAPNSGGNV